LFSGVATLAAGLSEVGVALTNDQAEAVEAKIKDIKKKIALLESQIQ
jgi:hypothetical protein